MMQTKAETMGETVAAHSEWIDGHEKRCAERYLAIQTSITEMRSTMRGQSKVAIGVILSIVGWMAVQLYNGQQAARSADRADVSANEARISALERAPGAPPVTVVQAPVLPSRADTSPTP